MYRSIRFILVNAACLLLCATAYGQVRINEVGYSGVDFQGASKWVELHNTDSSDVDVSSFWLCNFPNYTQIANLTALQGSTTIPAGGFLVVALDALGDGDGEVGLYQDIGGDFGNFGRAGFILDYMQYGSAGHQRESVAVADSVWDAGTFGPAAANGQSLAFIGGGSTTAEAWQSSDPSAGSANPADPATAAHATVDRFSAEAGTLFVRDDTNGLPEAGEPIDFDQGEPFLTQGFGPNGEIIQYYNFDGQPTTPAQIFVLFREGESMPVEDQLNLIDVIPGDEGYNDFWQVVRVTVPADYVANTTTSVEALTNAGFTMEALDAIVNCPVVPEGSTASLRLAEGNTPEQIQGWYRDQAVFYFEFGEAPLATTATGQVPVSPIYVTFNINPGEPGGGPPSGFVTEPNSVQSHNVIATLPGDVGYSPLWVVNIFDNTDFDSVQDLATAQAATILAAGAALVNCPVLSVEENTGTAIESISDQVPSGFVLHGNYPNPFNPVTTIAYEIDVPGRVVLRIYNVLGERVIDLVDGSQTSGVYRVTWDGRDARGYLVASGLYLYRLMLNGRQSQVRTLTLLK